jgi:hypothetical protein
MREKRNVMQGFLGKPEIGHLVDVEVDRRTISRWILKKQNTMSWTVSWASYKVNVVGS